MVCETTLYIVSELPLALERLAEQLRKQTSSAPSPSCSRSEIRGVSSELLCLRKLYECLADAQDANAFPTLRLGQNLSDYSNADEARSLLEKLLEAGLPSQMASVLEGAGRGETQDLITLVFEALLNLCVPLGMSSKVALYLKDHPTVWQKVLERCESQKAGTSFALVFQAMCLPSPHLAGSLLESGGASWLIHFIDDHAQAPPTTAICCLRDLLLTHPEVTVEYLLGHFDDFFLDFHCIVRSSNREIRVQATMLLAEMLLDVRFAALMRQYSQNSLFFELHLIGLLEPPTGNGSMQAAPEREVVEEQVAVFHVVKVFAANPFKPEAVACKIALHRERLLDTITALFDYDEADACLEADLAAVACIVGEA